MSEKVWTAAADVKSMGDLIDAAKRASHAFRYVVWFRGHASTKWTLLPSVRRKFPIGGWEANLANVFRLHAGARHSKCPDYRDLPGWLCLMQNYGLPTRLLDWTESVLMAAFFAVGMGSEPGPAAVWALSPIKLNELQIGVPSVPLLSDPTILDLVTSAFGGSKHPDKNVAVLHPEVDLRMLIQQGTFTVHGAVTPLEQAGDSEHFLMKFEIPESAKPNLEWELRLSGFSRSKVFPDLGNLAADVLEQQLRASRRSSK